MTSRDAERARLKKLMDDWERAKEVTVVPSGPKEKASMPND